MTSLLWTLIAIQIVMGVFDTFYHHELTERLAWRPSQRYELQLHSLRNMLYAFLFLVLGWLEVHGLFAMFIIAVLVAEIVITLMDFVEEDMSRKLPASERINHTLLAINYGAILVLLLPVLIGWAMQPTGIKSAYAGLLSIVAAASAIGAALCGLRDFAASKRLARMTSAPAAGLVEKLPARQTVLVTGATGFIGSRLVASLSRRRPSGHRAGARSRQGRHAAAADHADHEPRSASGGQPDRYHRQSRRRADRQRAVDRSQAPQDPGLPHQHDRRCYQADRAAGTQAGGAGLRLRDRLVRALAGPGADRVREVPCLLQP